MQLGRAPVCHGIIAAWPTIPHRYCALKFEDFTLNDEKHLLYSRFARTSAALPANAVRVLRTCECSIRLAVCREREKFLAALRRAAMGVGNDASELNADLEALILAYEEAVRKPGAGVAVDIGGVPDTSTSRLRAYVRAYGRPLGGWPDMVTIGQSIL